MSKSKVSLGFRTTEEKDEKEEHFEEWDIYPTHLLVEDGTWTFESN